MSSEIVSFDDAINISALISGESSRLGTGISARLASSKLVSSEAIIVSF